MEPETRPPTYGGPARATTPFAVSEDDVTTPYDPLPGRADLRPVPDRPGTPLAGGLAESAGDAELRLELPHKPPLRVFRSIELGEVPPAKWLIDRVVPHDSLVWLWGPPGCGKSFLALDWAGCVSQGVPWNRREVHRGRVLYLAAEGASGLRPRVRAWEHRTGEPMAQVYFLPAAVQLTDPQEAAHLVALVDRLKADLIIIDTQARCTIGAEENSNRDMGLVVATLDALRKVNGACVVSVHHSDKAGAGLRGASALKGAADTEVHVTKSGNQVTVSCEKQKDAEPFEEMPFRLEEAGASCVLTPLRHSAGNTDSEHKVLEALRAVPESTALSSSELRELTGLSRATMTRVTGSLTRKGLLRNVGSEKRPHWKLAGPGL